MSRWTFDEVVVDMDARELRRADTPVQLSPKAFELLGILVESRPRALSKAELQDRLWPGTFVVEKNLTNLVGEIRAALGDAARAPRFIRTVPRFGYAFIGAGSARDRSEAPRTSQLPEPLTNFVGRQVEIAEILRRLPATRLMTLTGPGGSGKTRLAIELARRLTDGPDGQVWLVDLAPLTNAALLAPSVADALALRDQPGRSKIDVIVGALGDRPAWLLLDNCEHLVAGVARLAGKLLRAASSLRILATSREALGVDGEVVWNVEPLAMPERTPDAGADSASRCESVRLFLARAAAADPAFTLTAENAPAVADVCRRLEGLPLALELAAARLRVLTIDQLRERLAGSVQVLGRRRHDAADRQRTLDASVEWSYELLSLDERRLLHRLSVFAAGWTLESAEGIGAGGAIGEAQVLDLLSRLVDKSLAHVVASGAGGRRYRCLEVVRQYAAAGLQRAGEAASVRDRHLSWFLDFSERVAPQLLGRDQVRAIAQLHAEHGNLRAALEWGLADAGRAPRGIALADALVWFWILKGQFEEGEHWLERARAAGAVSEDQRARLLIGLGNMAFFRGEFARAGERFVAGAEAARRCGDLTTAAHGLGMHALGLLETGDLEGGRAAATAGLAAAGTVSDAVARAPSLAFLAYDALHAGDVGLSARLHEEALALLRDAGNAWGMAIALLDLALVRVVQGRPADARLLCVEATDLSRAMGDLRGIAWALGVLAGAEAVEGRPARAATLRGAMEGLLSTAGAPLQPSFERWIFDAYFGRVERTLGAVRYRQAVHHGRVFTPEAALSFALDRATRAQSAGVAERVWDGQARRAPRRQPRHA